MIEATEVRRLVQIVEARDEGEARDFAEALSTEADLNDFDYVDVDLDFDVAEAIGGSLPDYSQDDVDDMLMQFVD